MNELLKRVTIVTENLIQITTGEGYDIADLRALTQIWGKIPTRDEGDITYLDAAGQCIAEVSNLVDQKFPDLSQEARVARKYRLMAKLLVLKADQLEN